MTLSNQGNTLDQTIAAIQSLDLTMIKFKATCKEDGYGWSDAYAETMAVAYKRYLILHAKHPEAALAPERDIDRFWHLHILDTRKYAADCDATFGRFVHHFPYLGLRGEEDAQALQVAFARMQQLYAQEFGEAMPGLQHDVSGAAFCSVEADQPEAAFCSAEARQATAAFCSIEKSRVEAAFCSIEKAQAQAAFCSVDVRQLQAAFCSADTRQPKAAFCSVDTRQAQAAFCSIEAEGKVASA